MDPLSVIGSLAVGLAAGVLSGLFGVGGAVLTTPGIRALGTSPIQAVGSTVPAILPGAITGAHRYARAGLVDWRVALTCGGAGAAFAVGGSAVTDLLDARWLMVATAGLLLVSGASTIRKARVAPPERLLVPTPDARVPATVEPDDSLPAAAVTTPVLVGTGAVAGFVAGLLGVGGGVIMMPLFTNVLKLPVKVAVGSSLVSVAMFAVPSMVTHAYYGHIDWPVALLLIGGTVPGARLGSHIAIGAGERTLRLALGIFFCAIAFIYGGRELAGIL